MERRGRCGVKLLARSKEYKSVAEGSILRSLYNTQLSLSHGRRGGGETDGVHAASSMEAFTASLGTFSSGAMGFSLAIHEARGTMDDHGGHESMTQTRDWAPSVTPRS